MTLRMTMRGTVIAAAGCFGTASAAQAAPLAIVNVGAPAINCVFSPTKIPNASPPACMVTVSDSVGTFTPPGDSGEARLQSRTYPGTAPAPAAGDMAHVYRVDLASVKGARRQIASLRLRSISALQSSCRIARMASSTCSW